MKDGDILFTILNTPHAIRFNRFTWMCTVYRQSLTDHYG